MEEKRYPWYEEASIPYLGEASAFVTAIIWASAVILFKKSGEIVPPIALNLFKCILALVLFVPTMLLLHEPLFRDAPLQDYSLLLLSGVLGIGIADTLFFKCLNLLGAGMTAIVECLYSPFVIGLSILLLGESLSLSQFIGAACIISGIVTATNTRARGHLSVHNLVWGFVFGIGAMACVAIAIVMIKPVLNRSPLLWVTQIRIAGGTVMLLFVLLFHRRRSAIIRTFTHIHSWKYTITGSFLGSYVAMVLWLCGMKYTQASVAAALNQTSNLFIFVFAALFLKETINRQRVIAICLGVCGAILVIVR